MSVRRRICKLIGIVTVTAIMGLSASADSMSPADRAKQLVANWNAETKVPRVDQDRLTVHRLDVVDENNVIRMTLATPTPLPIVDGIQYKRIFPASGLIIYDKNGDERGGFAVADIAGSAVVAAQDHANTDAIGWRVNADGSVEFGINQRPPIARDAALNGHIVPENGASRIKMSVGPDGSPSISLADKQERPRVRLALTKEGFGAIEFLNAEGKIISTLAPESVGRAKRW